MYCHFEATTMDKQICFVLLSCVFATVYLQPTIDDKTEALVISNIQDFYKTKEPVYLSQVLLYESFEVMSHGYYLVHVRALNAHDIKLICTVVLKPVPNSKTPNVTGTECKRDRRHIPLIQPLVDLGYFQKTVNKAVDLINNETVYRMGATSLKEIRLTYDVGITVRHPYIKNRVVGEKTRSGKNVKLETLRTPEQSRVTITGGKNLEYRFILTVAKRQCPYTPMDEEYNSILCPTLNNNQTYRVIGQIDQDSPNDSVVNILCQGAVHSTS